MILVKALRDFENGGITLFQKDDEIEVKQYLNRYFLVNKKIGRVLIPFGFVEEIKEEVLK